MNDLFQVLTELSIDPMRLDDFLSDPGGAAARLSAEDQAALALWGVAPAEGALPGVRWARCATCADPGPDFLPDPDPAYEDENGNDDQAE